MSKPDPKTTVSVKGPDGVELNFGFKPGEEHTPFLHVNLANGAQYTLTFPRHEITDSGVDSKNPDGAQLFRHVKYDGPLGFVSKQMGILTEEILAHPDKAQLYFKELKKLVNQVADLMNSPDDITSKDTKPVRDTIAQLQASFSTLNKEMTHKPDTAVAHDPAQDNAAIRAQQRSQQDDLVKVR